MHKIDGPGATKEKRFTEGDPVIPVPATTVTADWLNMVQDELEAIVSAAGLNPDKENNSQVRDALQTLHVPPARKINTTAPLTGGSALSGDVTLQLNATPAATANYVIQRDTAGRAKVAAPAAADDIARKAEVDAVRDDLSGYVGTGRKIDTAAPLTGGGALSGDMTLNINATPAATGNYVIQRDAAGRAKVAAPAAADDIARKAEVDAASTIATWDGVSGKPATYSPAAHNHDTGDITGGTLPVERGGTGANTAADAVANLGVYFLCEFYYFRHPTLKPGFQPAQGGVITSAATRYPDAWAYLQTAAGKLLCKTEEEWQNLTKATWATLADGTKVGWNGIGGAPFYVVDTVAGTIRLPDLRGMYAEAAGFDSLGVGGVHGDGIRNIVGVVGSMGMLDESPPSGAFMTTGTAITNGNYYNNRQRMKAQMDASRVVPTANKVQGRAWGALGCVYLGAPK